MSHYENWAYLSHEDLEALIESGDIQLIDIREEKEIGEQGVFPGAINIPCNVSESHHEKTCYCSFRPDPARTGL